MAIHHGAAGAIAEELGTLLGMTFGVQDWIEVDGTNVQTVYDIAAKAIEGLRAGGALRKQRRHVRLRHQGGACDYSGDGSERRTDAEHQHEDAPDIVAEMPDHMRMGEGCLNDQADARLLEDNE